MGMRAARSMKKRDAAVRIVRALRDAGHEAYFAGGCVRDHLLGISPKDYDVATSAEPSDIHTLLHSTRHVGEAFGVVLARIGGHQIEVATFRLEWGYEDGRRPTEVHFTDAQHDALRRDFTINGLFEDPLAEDPAHRVLDFVGGLADLKAGIVRAIGDPLDRFEEDHLRMLRAVRFAARLGFELDPRTAEAIGARADRLAQISRERIGQELRSMLSPQPGARRARAANLVQDLHLDAPTFQEAHQDPKLLILQNLHPDASYPTALAAWMLNRDHELGSASWGDPVRHQGLSRRVGQWRKALRLSNDDRDCLRGILGLLPGLFSWPRGSEAKKKRLLADPFFPQARFLLGALGPDPHLDTDAGAPEPGDLVNLVRQIDQESASLLARGVLPRPFICGEDLIALGQKPGPPFGRLLEEAYDAQLNGTVQNRDEALQWLKCHAHAKDPGDQ